MSTTTEWEEIITAMWSKEPPREKDVLTFLSTDKKLINHQNGRGQTLLYCAARNGLDKVVLLLIENGAQIDMTENHGSTPLHGKFLSLSF